MEQEFTQEFSSELEQLTILQNKLKAREEQKRNSAERKRISIKVKSGGKDPSGFKRETEEVEPLAKYFSNIENYYEDIVECLEKRKCRSLQRVGEKLGEQQYKTFLSGLSLWKVEQGRLIEEGKYHGFHYIILEGCLVGYRQGKEQVADMVIEEGEMLISNSLPAHKYNPLCIKSRGTSLLLRFTDDWFQLHLKKHYLKEIDEIAQLLEQTVIFQGLPLLQIKKYVPYFLLKHFHYNQQIYGSSSQWLFVICEGQVEISHECQKENIDKQVLSSLYKLKQIQKKHMRVVKLGRSQIFGQELSVQFQHSVKVVSHNFIAATVSLSLLQEIQNQNPIVNQNLSTFLIRTRQFYEARILRNEKIGQITHKQSQQKPKRKKKGKKKGKISLEWWGLAQKCNSSKQFKLPTPPKRQPTKKSALVGFENTNKIEYFKRRLFEEGLEEIEQIQRVQGSPFAMNYIPKLQKVKLKLVSIKPKVVNNAQRIRKKLVEYAKNDQVFCDKLQLE